MSILSNFRNPWEADTGVLESDVLETAVLEGNVLEEESPCYLYELEKYGHLKELGLAKNNYHTIYSRDRKESIQVKDRFILSLSSSKKGMFKGKERELSTSFRIRDILFAKGLFRFLANYSEVEFGLTIYNATSKYASPYAFITTSHEQGVNHAQIYYETHWLYDNKDAKIIETWHNHPNAKLGYDYRGPSGYYEDTTLPNLNMKESDFFYLKTMKKEFGNRIPNEFFLYDAYNKIDYLYDDKGFVKLT